MKCKYCGSELTGKKRFCSNCGMTVRQVPNNARFADERRRPSNFNVSPKSSKPHPTNGKPQRPADDGYARYNTYMRNKQTQARKERQKKIRFRRTVLLLILLAIIVSVVAAMISFNMTKDSGIANINPEISEPTIDPMATIMPEGEDIPVIGEDDDQTPSSSPSAKPKATATPTPAPGKVKEGYTAYKEAVSGISCPYPSDFEKSDVTSSATKISVTDGKAEMRINTEKATTQDTADSLLKSYASGIGVNPTESSAGDGVYTISFIRNGKYNHRTGVVYENRHIYYDFSCKESEASSSAYTQHISYADKFLKDQINALKSDN